MQAYQIFFSMGLAYGIAGVLLWPLYVLGLTQYPSSMHPTLMINGFLMSFATGFLLTATPRFTRTKTPGKIYIWLLFVIQLAAFGSILITSLDWLSYIFIFLNYFSLLIFYLHRRKMATFDVPELFDLIAVSLFCGSASAIIFILSINLKLDSEWFIVSKKMMYVNMVLFLIIGIGNQLIATLLGWGKNPVRVEFERKLKKTKYFSQSKLIMSLVTVSVCFDLFKFTYLSQMILTGVLIWISLTKWKLLKKPNESGILSFWLWISCWGLLIGMVMSDLFRSYGVHANHLIYVMGFSTIVILVATRVTLAHGGYDVSLEKKSKALRYTIFLIIMGGLTRTIAPLMPATYTRHLAYASLTWVMGAIVWAWYFIPKIMLVDSEIKNN